MADCTCPMRDGAHESQCGRVGEYDTVHCLDCDEPVWMCRVALSRCPACRAAYEAGDECKVLVRQTFRDVVKSIRKAADELKPPVVLSVSSPVYSVYRAWWVKKQMEEMTSRLLLAMTPLPPDTPVGTLDIRPDGTADIVLNEAGRRLYGPNFTLKVINVAPPEADQPVIAEAAPA